MKLLSTLTQLLREALQLSIILFGLAAIFALAALVVANHLKLKDLNQELSFLQLRQPVIEDQIAGIQKDIIILTTNNLKGEIHDYVKRP